MSAMSTARQAWTELAAQVKRRREYLGLGQVDLGVSDLTLRKVEQGQGAGLRPKTLRQIESGLRWRPGTVNRILDGTATTEDLLGGFGVLWMQNLSGGPLVVVRPAPDADTLTVESMAIVQVVGAVAEALPDAYRTEHRDRPRSWPTSQWKLIRYDQSQATEASGGPAEATAAGVSVGIAGNVVEVSTLSAEQLAGLGGPAVARMSVELLGQLVAKSRRTPAEERLIQSLLAVVAEQNGASVAYATGTASITMTTIDLAVDDPATQTSQHRGQSPQTSSGGDAVASTQPAHTSPAGTSSAAGQPL
ncbi:MAG: hypothetical protein ABS81_04760 [Pseudonocardia sp. SCN 72-86]|nr:MAG: hypothetical protein ABS81_04760 [Pseudonocardia sp. SCN 72-86]